MRNSIVQTTNLRTTHTSPSSASLILIPENEKWTSLLWKISIIAHSCAMTDVHTNIWYIPRLFGIFGPKLKTCIGTPHNNVMIQMINTVVVTIHPRNKFIQLWNIRNIHHAYHTQSSGFTSIIYVCMYQTIKLVMRVWT